MTSLFLVAEAELNQEALHHRLGPRRGEVNKSEIVLEQIWNSIWNKSEIVFGTNLK
jgi:hypothetical protein